MEKELENIEKKKRRKQPSRPTKPSQAARPRARAVWQADPACQRQFSPAPSLSCSLPAGADLSAPVTSPAHSLSLSLSLSLFVCLTGPDRHSPSRCPAYPFSSLSASWAYPVSSVPSALVVDRHVRTRARRQISRPRRPPTRAAPFLEPRQCPAHTPHLISLSFTISRALLTPPAAAKDPHPRSQPSSLSETAPSLTELHLKVRHPSPCPISPVAPCVRPISPSPVLGRDGPPCSRGGRPI
jgi:hypothetical protein